MGRQLSIDAPWDFTVAHNTTVGFRVWKRSLVAGKEVLDAEDLSAARYVLRLRGRIEGASTYLVDKVIPKADGAEGYFEGFVDAFAASAEGKTVVFWVVLVDADLAPGGDTETDDFEEILGEFTRTIRPALASA